jgi:hypothetical protein
VRGAAPIYGNRNAFLKWKVGGKRIARKHRECSIFDARDEAWRLPYGA